MVHVGASLTLGAEKPVEVPHLGGDAPRGSSGSSQVPPEEEEVPPEVEEEAEEMELT